MKRQKEEETLFSSSEIFSSKSFDIVDEDGILWFRELSGHRRTEELLRYPSRDKMAVS